MEKMFYEVLQQHNIELNDTQKRQFSLYADMLMEWNKKMNLTAIDDRESIYVKHFLDCVYPSFYTHLEGSLCDIGAGAGFPSIPLKIVYPQLKITIVETLQKRCTFLKELVKTLQLENVEIVNARAEDYAKIKREQFDVVTARAVANLTMLSELCIPFVRKNGIFLAMKGKNANEELEQGLYACTILGCELEDTYDYTLEDATRINFVFRKTKNTPKKYPRAFAKIKKEPLVKK